MQDSVIYFVLYLFLAAVICVVVIGGVRLVRAIIAGSRALEQMGRAMEEIASTLKKDRM